MINDYSTIRRDSCNRDNAPYNTLYSIDKLMFFTEYLILIVWDRQLLINIIF